MSAFNLRDDFCTFDSEGLINLGFGVPAKNYGIKIIKKYLFNNKLTYPVSPDKLNIEFANPEQVFWDFLRQTKKELADDNKKERKLFSKMKHGQILFEDGHIYVRWNERGVTAYADLNEEQKTAEIDFANLWDYPKSNRMSKKDAEAVKRLITEHFAYMGYESLINSDEE